MICPRCKREVHPWPLKRPNTCSPKSWAYCIRNDMPERVMAVYRGGPLDGQSAERALEGKYIQMWDDNEHAYVWDQADLLRYMRGKTDTVHLDWYEIGIDKALP